MSSRVDLLLRDRPLDWEDSTATEIAVTGDFISTHGGQIHHGLGGSPQLDIATGQCGPFRPYLQLESALKFYIPNMLRLQMPESITGRMWDDLSEKIGLMEKQCKGTKNGFWHSLWHKIGQRPEAAEAWMAFIPDEYGLGVVKAGLALVFKLAEASAEKQQRIYDTFAALRDTLIQAQPERRSFRANQQVNDTVDRLYQCVVDSIHDIAVWLSAENHSTWDKVTSKFKRHRDTASASPEEILQTLGEHTKNFRDALCIARDQAIEDTELISRVTGLRTVLIHKEILATRDDVLVTRRNSEHIKTGIEAYTKTAEQFGTQFCNRVERVERVGGKISDRVSHLHVDLSLLTRKVDEQAAVISALVGELRQQSEAGSQGAIEPYTTATESGSALQKDQRAFGTPLMPIFIERERNQVQMDKTGQSLSRPGFPKTLVSFRDFLAILTCSSYSPRPQGCDPYAIHHLSARDLESASNEEKSFPLRLQGRVQYLFKCRKFLYWLNDPSHSLLLVDANINGSAASVFSVTSVFAANLTKSIMSVLPEQAAVVHFFCGPHSRIGGEYHGPKGMMRFLIAQLALCLDGMDPEMEMWSLRFINGPERLARLEQHDLGELCQTFHALLDEFPEGMTVYCVIDSVVFMDRDRMWPDFEFVMQCLDCVVNDDGLRATVQVLMFNQAGSTYRMKKLPELEGKKLDLAPSDCFAVTVSKKEVEKQLQQALREQASAPPEPPRLAQGQERWFQRPTQPVGQTQQPTRPAQTQTRNPQEPARLGRPIQRCARMPEGPAPWPAQQPLPVRAKTPNGSMKPEQPPPTRARASGAPTQSPARRQGGPNKRQSRPPGPPQEMQPPTPKEPPQAHDETPAASVPARVNMSKASSTRPRARMPEDSVQNRGETPEAQAPAQVRNRTPKMLAPMRAGTPEVRAPQVRKPGPERLRQSREQGAVGGRHVDEDGD